jgi:hypothetical protein
MREYQLSQGLPREQVYNQTMLILAGMLAIGFVCNLLIRPVDDKWFMNDTELTEEKRLAHEKVVDVQNAQQATSTVAPSGNIAWVLMAWLAISIPLVWGIYKTLANVAKFFS